MSPNRVYTIHKFGPFPVDMEEKDKKGQSGHQGAGQRGGVEAHQGQRGEGRAHL